MGFQIPDLLAEHLLLGRTSLQRVSLEHCRTETNCVCTQEPHLLSCLVTGGTRTLPRALSICSPHPVQQRGFSRSHTPIPMPSQGKHRLGAGGSVSCAWEHLPSSAWCPSDLPQTMVSFPVRPRIFYSISKPTPCVQFLSHPPVCTSGSRSRHLLFTSSCTTSVQKRYFIFCSSSPHSFQLTPEFLQFLSTSLSGSILCCNHLTADFLMLLGIQMHSQM